LIVHRAGTAGPGAWQDGEAVPVGSPHAPANPPDSLISRRRHILSFVNTSSDRTDRHREKGRGRGRNSPPPSVLLMGADFRSAVLLLVAPRRPISNRPHDKASLLLAALGQVDEVAAAAAGAAAQLALAARRGRRRRLAARRRRLGGLLLFLLLGPV